MPSSPPSAPRSAVSRERLLDLVIEESEARPPAVPRAEGPTLGRIVGWSEAGHLLVDSAGGSAPHEARTTVPVQRDQVGREVVLLFENGDSQKPIVVGVLQDAQPAGAQPAGAIDVRADEHRVTIRAEQEIALECGDASIVLTRAGKVLIKGAFVLTDAIGVNRIRGGAVQIN